MTETPDTRPIGHGTTVTAAELRIGDVVSWQFHDGFDTAVVENIRYGTNHSVSVATVVRPYALIGDAITTAGVSVTVGIEKTEVSLDSTLTFKLIRKSDVERHWRAVDAERKQFEAEITRLKDALADKAILAEDLKGRAKELKNELAITESNLSLAKNSLDNVRRERDELKDQLHTAEANGSQAETTLAVLRGRVAAALDNSLGAK